MNGWPFWVKFDVKIIEISYGYTLMNRMFFTDSLVLLVLVINWSLQVRLRLYSLIFLKHMKRWTWPFTCHVNSLLLYNLIHAIIVWPHVYLLSTCNLIFCKIVCSDCEIKSTFSNYKIMLKMLSSLRLIVCIQL